MKLSYGRESKKNIWQVNCEDRRTRKGDTPWQSCSWRGVVGVASRPSSWGVHGLGEQLRVAFKGQSERASAVVKGLGEAGGGPEAQALFFSLAVTARTSKRTLKEIIIIKKKTSTSN